MKPATVGTGEASRPARQLDAIELAAGPAPSHGPEISTASPVADLPPRPVTTRRLRAARAAIVAADVLAVLAATGVSRPPSPAVWIVAGLTLAAAVSTYRPVLPLNLSMLGEVPYLVRRMGIALLVAAPLIGASDHAGRLLTQAIASGAFIVAGRTGTYGLIRLLRRRGYLVEVTLVAGANGVTHPLIEALGNQPDLGLRLVALATEDATTRNVNGHGRVPTRAGRAHNGHSNGHAPAMTSGDHRPLGPAGLNDTSVDELVALTEALDIRRVIVTPHPDLDDAHVQALRRSLTPPVHLHVVSPFSDVVPTPHSPSADVVRGYLLQLVTRPVPSGLRWLLKRLFDIVGALVVLTVASPVLVVAAVGVKLSSRGPVLFRQPRVGRSGRLFVMYKFRTFPVDHVDTEFSLPHSACPLWFGRLLRRTSIDELPQLVNVVRGDMSLVGPRPERPHFAEPFARTVAGYADRHRVPGGITGLAQIHGEWGNRSIEERVRLDNHYIDSWSLWQDVVILARTPLAVFRKSWR